MKPHHKWPLGIAFGASLLAAFLGFRFYFEERSYAAAHPNSDLATQLQSLGLGVGAAGVAGVALSYLLYRYLNDEPPEG